MHQLYVERYEPKKYIQWKADKTTKFEINYEFYLHIFNSKFNLSFGKPKMDVCNTCDKFKNQIDVAENPEEKSRLNREHSLHLAKAQKFYDDLNQLSKKAKTDETVDVISFDYQQNLPVPVLPIVEGEKGANETVSFLKHYVDSVINPSVKTLYIFTDNCVGQNKNMVVVQMLSALVATGRFNIIYHRFPERGHSFLPCDRKFALEKEKRKVTYLYLPEEWYSKVARTSQTFLVVNILPKMIRDFRSYFQPFFKKTIKNFTITKYKTFKYEEKKITVSACHNIDTLNRTFIAFKPNADLIALKEWTVPQLYITKLPVNPKKLQNLRELLDFIPLAYHGFYVSLETQDGGEQQQGESETEASDSSDE
ncbi:uncharacterized protein LOC115887048 [Sitophilus oryzae]|uniref:Uncharacterized protein LOC115887048 n=1 Tax=Sitophilus oryzae TaxID=7048 RepID=A0A6J2YH66_SITOR|nr:uncharacterized protein LOC115887048 [Sitophilus oryzae]